MACSRLGAMLHLEIQKGEEAMKTPGFQKDLGGTAKLIILSRSRFTINGILLHDASSKLYFCEGTCKNEMVQ